MDNQFELFDRAPQVVDFEEPKPLTIQECFEVFHKLNPWVADALQRLALDLKLKGRKKIGIGMLVEVLRWNYYRSTEDPNCIFKINNNYRSRYARMLEQRDARLVGAFELRELKTP